MASAWALGMVLAAAPVLTGAAQEGLVPSPTPSSSPLQTTTPATKIYLSAWLAELLKLAQAGIEEEVQLSFINTAGTFNLTSDHIIYLRDLGVSNMVITAMIQHDWDLATGVRQVPASAVPPLAPEVPAAFVSHTPPPVPPLAQPITSSPPTAEAQSAESAAVELPPTEELNRPEPLEEQTCSPAPQMTLAPVRAPYPVKLTDPIIVLRAAGRMPNTMLLESFP